MADNISNVTDSDFQSEVIDASKNQPVLVDFWAEWCRPCHMLAPTVAEIANDFTGKLKVVKLNVDENVNAAGRFNIPAFPPCSSSRVERWPTKSSAPSLKNTSRKSSSATSTKERLQAFRRRGAGKDVHATRTPVGRCGTRCT